MLLALLLAAAILPPAEAATLTQVVIVKVSQFPGEDLASGDSYHVAYMISDGTRETWRVDGRKIGDYPSGASRPNDRLEAALNGDGSRLAVALMTYDSNGRPLGPAVYVNGAPEDVYSEIKDLRYVSGRLVYKAAKDAWWRVVVDGAKGPQFHDEPSNPIFNGNGSHFAYVGRYEDGYHLLLDHEPIQAWPGEDIYASADWRVRGSPTTEPDFDHRFKLGDTKIGHYHLVMKAAVSPDGRHAAVVDSVDGGYQVSLDGKPEGPSVGLIKSLKYAPNGVPWWLALDHKFQRSTVYRNGFEDGSYDTVWGEDPVSFGPGGSSAYVVTAEKGGPAELIVNGRSVLSGVKIPVDHSKIVFDDADELHWISLDVTRGYVVNCVSLSGRDAESSRCAQKARRLHADNAASDE